MGEYESLLLSLAETDTNSTSIHESKGLHLLYRTSGSLAFISLLGALFVIVSFIVIKELRRYPTSMVFYLSICDLAFSLKYVITSVIPDSFRFQHTGSMTCYLQAGTQQFFGLSSISWSGMVSLNLILQSRRPFESTSGYAKFFHMGVWGLSTTTTILMFALGSIGPSGDGTCWVENEKSPIRLLFFVLLLLYFSLSIASLIIAAVYSRNSSNNSTFSDRNRKGMLLRMSFYTMVFILCWSGPLAHKIAQVSGKKDDYNHPSALIFLDAIGVSIQGFMNAVIWFTNPSFVKKFLQFLSKYMPSLGNLNEKTPLISSLQDEALDPIQFAVVLRNNILTCCLRGISLSVNNDLKVKQQSNNTNSNDSTNQPIIHSSNISSNAASQSNIGLNDINQIPNERVYTEKDLFNIDQSLGGSSSGDCSRSSSTFKFKDYNPYYYSLIRSQQNLHPQEYLESFDETRFFENLSNQKFSEGKSGSFMCFTPDNKYLIKTITRQESILLRKKIHKFYSYLNENRHSFLLRFYGSYKITMQNDHTVYLAVMSNVFSYVPKSFKLQERYDLKGSTVNRGGQQAYKGVGLGLDNDFLSYRGYLRVPDNQKRVIVDQLRRDAEFLQSLNIMDYSLLIGTIPINEKTQESININSIQESIENADFTKGVLSEDSSEIFYIGVIDILQLFDMSKKLERFCKVYVVRKNRTRISAIPPDPYKERYMIRMKQVFNMISGDSNNNLNNNF